MAQNSKVTLTKIAPKLDEDRTKIGPKLDEINF